MLRVIERNEMKCLPSVTYYSSQLPKSFEELLRGRDRKKKFSCTQEEAGPTLWFGMTKI